MIIRIEMEYAIEGDLPDTPEEYQEILDNELDKVANTLASTGINMFTLDAELMLEE
jgi:hypothetical protein